jgi:hydrogenase nickel incorporation protein HypA/HybF
MHELGIAYAVLDAVRTEMQRYPGQRPCKVGVRIGEMAGLDQEAFRFCFEAITRETDLESLDLGIEICPLRHHCTVCGHEFIVRDYQTRCPRCTSLNTDYMSGQELDLAYLEVEEYGAGATGTESPQ